MKSNRRNKNPKILNMAIVLPIATLAITSFMFFMSNAYAPSWAFDWRGIRPEIRDTVELIERYGSVTSSVVGYAGKTPQQWHRRRWLMQNATEGELKKLIEHSNGAVVATAYEGLIKKPNTKKYQWINRALNDTIISFGYQSGCVELSMTIGEYLVKNVVPISDIVLQAQPSGTEKFDFLEQEISNLRKLYYKRVNREEKP